jgi:L-rhamnose isomerase
MAESGLTLSHPDEKVRRFWVSHCQATRRVAAYFGRETGSPALCNLWIPDGFKETPACRLSPRKRLKESLDEIYAEKFDPAHIVDSVESKLFGIGLESCTVGSHEFYLNYAAQNGLLCLFDSGHFHPTETISDKISSMLLFNDQLALHVSRGVRWDSDHTVVFDDDLRALGQAIVASRALGRVRIGLDFFDAALNRVAAWVLGVRNVQKALLYALCMPLDTMRRMQDEGDATGLLVQNEACKVAPFGDVWDAFCVANEVPIRDEWLKIIREYEVKQGAR